jgi:hypothetical protein
MRLKNRDVTNEQSSYDVKTYLSKHPEKLH